MRTDYKAVFPFEKYREFQEETIKKVIRALNEDKTVIIVAPTGSGKTGIGISACRLNHSAFYMTPQKILQKQISRQKEFRRKDYTLKEIKGKSNYPCRLSNDELNCANGLCSMKKKQGVCGNCAYLEARYKAKDAQTCLTNFSYFITAPIKVFVRSDEKLSRNVDVRDILIIDECHRITDIMLNHIEVKISLDLFPTSVLGETNFEKLIDKDDFISLQPFLEAFVLHLEHEIGLMERNIEAFEEDDYRKMKNKKIVSKKNRFDRLARRILSVYKEVYVVDEDTGEETVSNNWVMSYDKEKRMIVLQPIFVDRYMKRVWITTPMRILMSGSIMNPQQFIQDCGLEEDQYEVIQVPSSFPKKNRPIYLDYVGQMNYKNKTKTLPKMVDKVVEIAKKYPNDKIIVHCHSYYNAEFLKDGVSLKSGRRLILQNSEDREESYNEWQRTKNGVFLSVNMTEGLDLVEDMCRVQIMIKIPYAHLGDKRVKKRLEHGGQLWYSISAYETIIQAYGRAVRSETDWAHFYILDSAFGYLNYQCRKYVPKHFNEALIDSYRLKQQKEHLY